MTDDDDNSLLWEDFLRRKEWSVCIYSTYTWHTKSLYFPADTHCCNPSFWSPSLNILSSSPELSLPVILLPCHRYKCQCSCSKGWCSSTRACTNCCTHLWGKANAAAPCSTTEQKWEQVLPSNPFQTFLWIYELMAEGDGQIQACRRKTTLLAFLASSQPKTHHYCTAVSTSRAIPSAWVPLRTLAATNLLHTHQTSNETLCFHLNTGQCLYMLNYK